MKNFKKIAAALVAGSFLSIASINAQTLNLTGAALEQSLPGQELTQSFPPNSDDDGSISSWVVNDSTLDPYGYIFIYQVTNSGVDAVGDIELNGFTSGEIVSTMTYSNESGLTLTGALTPSADGNFTGFELIGGDAATFTPGNLANTSPNNISYFLVVDTSARVITTDYGQEQDSFSAYGSILTPVPEPSSLALLTGFACLFGLIKYRQIARARCGKVS